MSNFEQDIKSSLDRISLVNAAKNEDSESIRALLAKAGALMRKNDQLSEVLRGFIAAALQSIGNGASADDAFLLTRRGGRPKFLRSAEFYRLLDEAMNKPRGKKGIALDILGHQVGKSKSQLYRLHKAPRPIRTQFRKNISS